MASLKELTVAIPGAGRRTLLAALREDYALPEDFRLCVLDAERLTEPRQLALLDELAADPALRILFALNKADKVTGPRTLVTRTLALLRDRGFVRPELFPLCARAALLFRMPPERIAGSELMTEQGDFYFRYGPGEQSLSAFAVTRDAAVCLGSREVSAERLRLALENTGLPMLEGRLAARALKQEKRQQATGQGSGIKDQGSENGGTGPSAPLRCAQDDALDAPAEPAEAAPVPEPESAGRDGTLPSAPAETESLSGDVTPDAPAEPSVGGVTPGTPAEPSVGGGVLDASAEPLSGDGASDAPAEPAEAAPVPEPESAGRDGTLPSAPAETEPLAKDDAPAESREAAPKADPPAPQTPLEALMRRAAETDCAGLLELAKAVAADPAADEYRNDALDALHEAYNARQTRELEALTRDAETLDAAALRALTERIGKGAYTVQARTPYLELLNRRLEAIQAEDLARLCADVTGADAQTLAEIRAELEAADCAELLKTEHFRAIDARQEALDREALERVTAGAEDMTEQELQALAVTLQAGNWNPKFVNDYRHKVELCREAAILRGLNEELAELDDMERRELLALRESILSQELPLRFTAVPLTRIDEKIYRLDMLRLLALNNDFDRLDFEGLDALRAQVGRGDWCDRARNEYLSRLLEREQALVIENTDARAQLVRQLIGQHKLRMSDFDIASGSEAYRERLAAFWGGSGMEQPRDIPVFLLDNASDFALTGSRFYYKTGRDLAFLPLENIERFQTMKQHMSLILQVVGKDSSYRLTGARLGRSGAERVLAFLNECVRRWNEPGLAGAPSANPLRTRRFEPADYTAPVEELLPDEAMALEIFRSRCLREKLREGNLIREGEDGWEQRTRRLLLNFELPETTKLIWYCSSTLLGTVREGVALGPKAIYQKEGRQPTQIIPLLEILELNRSGKQITVSTVRGQSWRLELPSVMFSPVQDYVKAIQLGAFLRERAR